MHRPWIQGVFDKVGKASKLETPKGPNFRTLSKTTSGHKTRRQSTCIKFSGTWTSSIFKPFKTRHWNSQISAGPFCFPKTKKHHAMRCHAPQGMRVWFRLVTIHLPSRWLVDHCQAWHQPWPWAMVMVCNGHIMVIWVMLLIVDICLTYVAYLHQTGSSISEQEMRIW